MRCKGVATLVLATAIVLSSTMAYSIVERALIDFPTFEQNMSKVVENDRKIHESVISNDPSLDFTLYGYPKVELTPEDWKLYQWRVILASSANTVANNALSYCTNAVSSNYGQVLGARIHFPKWRFLSWALIMPPYEFYVYYDDGAYVNQDWANGRNTGNENSIPMGVLVNVGQVKSIAAWIYGLNYQHQIGIRLKDREDRLQEYFMGSTYYDGWRKLVWLNPNYVEDVRDRVLQRIPLYPKSYPYIKFDSYVVYKPETDLGGNYIIYFKDINVYFDRAIVREELDIEDETIWRILATETLEKKMTELKRISEAVELKRQEEKRVQEARK